jgi:hypothetical protein
MGANNSNICNPERDRCNTCVQRGSVTFDPIETRWVQSEITLESHPKFPKPLHRRVCQ